MTTGYFGGGIVGNASSAPFVPTNAGLVTPTAKTGASSATSKSGRVTPTSKAGGT